MVLTPSHPHHPVGIIGLSQRNNRGLCSSGSSQPSHFDATSVVSQPGPRARTGPHWWARILVAFGATEEGTLLNYKRSANLAGKKWPGRAGRGLPNQPSGDPLRGLAGALS